MCELKLAEHFVSINGEGQKAGELALFLRFAGCGLNCSWCDTRWANEKDAPYTLCSVPELLELAKEADVRNVTLTGGEPLGRAGIGELISGLIRAGYEVEIETNGSVPLEGYIGSGASFTMDYKLPSSGMESRMYTANLPLLTEKDTLKFVCGSGEDLERAAEILEEYKPACKVYLSPVFGMIEPAEMVDFMKERGLNGVRLQLQLHKFIWPPEMRGV